MSFRLRRALKSDRKDIKKLYYSAFPADERAPFYMITRKAQEKCSLMLVAEADGEFAGFVYLVGKGEVIYLFYLAVLEKFRGRGLGSAIVKTVCKKFSDKKIFLAREPLDENAENALQREMRREFYIKNGFKDQKSQLNEGGVIFDIMTTGGEITPEEYGELIDRWFGRLWRKIVTMEIIDS